MQTCVKILRRVRFGSEVIDGSAAISTAIPKQLMMTIILKFQKFDF
jgi:hypothetical protein